MLNESELAGYYFVEKEDFNMPLNINIQQILLHLFNFVLLFGIMYFLLYKPVKDYMEKRKNEYEEAEKKSQDDLQAASELKKQYEDKLTEADALVASMKAQSSREAEAEREKIIANANSKADEIVEKAKKKAESEADRIMTETKKEIAGYVADMAEKIVQDSEDPEGFNTFFIAAGNEEDTKR